ncbi:hypothetical protein DdX_08219 [Ditylenchus destructor]|uniref:Uncharacterized protein n=1 Tax=Ditylenchus destructor TaxID=166010 RepID=A0AAD4N6Z2_9BILA|nr:hypothetical protein DdX_08219 [Ditylenchus destructor]
MSRNSRRKFPTKRTTQTRDTSEENSRSALRAIRRKKRRELLLKKLVEMERQKATPLSRHDQIWHSPSTSKFQWTSRDNPPKTTNNSASTSFLRRGQSCHPSFCRNFSLDSNRFSRSPVFNFESDDSNHSWACATFATYNTNSDDAAPVIINFVNIAMEKSATNKNTSTFTL